MILHLFIVFVAMIAIWKIGDLFEDASEYLGRNLKNGVRGASLNAIASSMPELLTGFIFLFYLEGSDGYAGTIGTTAGSAVFNSLLIPALVIFVVYIYKIVRKGEKIELNPKVVQRDGFMLLLAEMALIVVISSNKVTWFDGLILLLIYVVYSIMLIKQGREEDEITPIIPGTRIETRSSWIKLIISVILMSIACFFLVDSVEALGEIWGIPLIFVSIILASAASSVPDTVISIKDGLRGNYDDAVSNALGSNIFDICVAHGLPLFIYTVLHGNITMSETTTQHSIELRISLLIITLLAVLIYVAKKKINTTHAWLLVIMYSIFVFFVISRGLNAQWAENFINLF